MSLRKHGHANHKRNRSTPCPKKVTCENITEEPDFWRGFLLIPILRRIERHPKTKTASISV